MKNPLFESLLSKANSYNNSIHEQDQKLPEGAVFADYIRSVAKMGSDLASNFISAINSYPEPSKFKDEYKSEMSQKLQKIIDGIDGDKTVSIQIESLLNLVEQELQNFLSDSRNDKEYVNLLPEWRENFKEGFKNYKLAIKKAKEYIKKFEDAGQAKSLPEDALLKKYLQDGLDEFNERESDKKILDESEKFDDTKNKNYLIEKLINNKIVLDFSSFDKIINESKEDRIAKRNAKAFLSKVETLQGLVTGILNQIAMRSGDPSKANFKSLKMNDEFVSLAKSVAEVKSELSVNDGDKKNIDFTQIEKTISSLDSLFRSKKENFDKSYSEESKSLKSFKTLEIATPDVEKYKSAGDKAFNNLSNIALNAANQASLERKKPKSTTGSTKETETIRPDKVSVKISEPVKYSSSKKGVVNDDVKKAQQLIIDKLGKKLADDESYKKFAKYGADGKFGQNTRNIIVAVKAGLGLEDNSSDVTQELMDKLSEVKESFSFIKEDFNIEAYKKSLSSPEDKSSKDSKREESSGASIPGPFNCIKTADNTAKISGNKATIERENGNKHIFNADGTYSYYWAKEDKTLGGTWKCATDGFEATTKSDNDIYYGKPGVMNWKSEMDKEERKKAEEKAKEAAALLSKAGEICKKIISNIAGDTENEETVAEIFRDDVTTPEMFKAVESFWNYKWWPSQGQLRLSPAVYRKKSVDEITTMMAFKPKKIGFSLRGLIKEYFNNSQKALLNGYLPTGIKKF